MKKLFMLLALVLGMVSCQNEPEALDVVVGGEQEVMLSVSLPEGTRANSAEGFDLNNLGDEYKVRYILEISYNGNLIRDFKITDATSATFPVRLAPNRDYTFTVWADLVTETEVENWYDADLYYNTVNGLANIELQNWTPNVEARDAWTATQTVTYTSQNKNIGMELKRPFAKVRVVATDIAEISKFDIVPTNAVAEYAQEMYTEFDAVAGVAKGETTGKTHEFAYTSDNAYEDATGELTLFADYVLVPTDGNVQFTLSVYDNTKGENALIKDNHFNTTIPVVKNKVTTIKGNVLTEGGDVSITVNGELGKGETIKYVDTIATLQEAINAATDGVETTIRLGGDVVIDDVTTRTEAQYGLVIPATKVIILDLNGKTISQIKAQSGKYAMIENNGTLTICNSANTNGTLSYGDTATLTADVGYASNTIQNNGVLTINEGVVIKNTSGEGVATYGFPHVIDTNGTLTINGGTLTNEANYSTMRIWTSNTDAEKCNVTINGGTFNGCIDFQAHNNNYATMPHYGTLTVNGGTFNADTFTNSAIRVLRFGVNANDMHANINGGTFNGKVWVRNIGTFESTPKIFDIYNGTFTTMYEGFDTLLANGYAFVEGENGTYTVASLGYYTDANGNYHITGINGWLWMAAQNDTFFGSKTIYLENDLDFEGVDIRVTRMFTPEYSATFDGQNHTVSNIWMASDYDKNNQALFDGLMTVKNLTVTNAQVYGMSQVGVIGANISGTIENCHVKKSRAYGYVWQIGGIVGLHSWGEIKNCSVEDTKIECFYYGAVGAIAGCMNEMSRNITNCTVKNCKLIKEGSGYADYDGLFGAFAGYVLTSGNHTFSGKIENTTTTVNGVTTESKVYGESAGTVVYNDTHYVASTDALTSAISAGATKFMLTEGNYVIPDSAAGKTLHFIGMGDPENTKIATNNETGSYEGCNYNLSGSTVTFENISINTTSTSYIGYAGLKATYKNCTINGFYCLYDNSTFEDCTFNVSGDNYNIWTWAAPNVTFERCTFNCDGKSVMLYGGTNTKLTVNNCTFNDKGGLVDELKAAIEVGNDYNMSYELIVNNTIVNGFAINNKGINTGTTLWANKNSMPQDKLNVIVDGVDVY